MIDTGATSNYMSLDLAQNLNVGTLQCSYFTLANGVNVSSFITKEKVLVKVGTFIFYSRFRVVKGLTYSVILDMYWWRMCEPIVDLGKGQVVVKKGGKVHYLSLETHDSVPENNIAINTLSNKPHPQEELEPTQLTIDMFKPLFNNNVTPNIPENLHFSIRFKPNTEKYMGSPIYSLDQKKVEKPSDLY